MFINDNYTTYSENELKNLNEDLNANGYERIFYGVWYEIWKKGAHEVVVKHDF